ncbi:MAG: Arc family DNA-binding protein [Pseudorhodobacter sp.]|nr:Arc family DNA-binding protein [Pseudorhodobacter sp.]
MTTRKSPFGLRMTADLRRWLEQRAEGNHRSLNQEILFLLGQVMAREAEPGRDRT